MEQEKCHPCCKLENEACQPCIEAEECLFGDAHCQNCHARPWQCRWKGETAPDWTQNGRTTEDIAQGTIAPLPDPNINHHHRRSAPHPRECALCHATHTPMWRCGPTNVANLCNACGLRYAKGTMTTEQIAQISSPSPPVPAALETPKEAAPAGRARTAQLKQLTFKERGWFYTVRMLDGTVKTFRPNILEADKPERAPVREQARVLHERASEMVPGFLGVIGCKGDCKRARDSEEGRAADAKKFREEKDALKAEYSAQAAAIEKEAGAKALAALSEARTADAAKISAVEKAAAAAEARAAAAEDRIESALEENRRLAAAAKRDTEAVLEKVKNAIVTLLSIKETPDESITNLVSNVGWAGHPLTGDLENLEGGLALAEEFDQYDIATPATPATIYN